MNICLIRLICCEYSLQFFIIWGKKFAQVSDKQKNKAKLSTHKQLKGGGEEMKARKTTNRTKRERTTKTRKKTRKMVAAGRKNSSSRKRR